MDLDLRTIYLLAAGTCLVLGLLQLGAFVVGRFERWPAFWGASNILIGLGCLGTATRGYASDIVSISMANVATLAGYAVLLLGVQSFSGPVTIRRNTTLYVLAVVAILSFFWQSASDHQVRIALCSFGFACCDLAIAREGMLIHRRERLGTAWLLTGMFTLTSLIFAGRTVFAALGHLGGSDMFGHDVPVAYTWFAGTATVFLIVRGTALLFLAAERDRRRLTEVALTDALTGVLNRRGLEEAFHRVNGDVSVLIVDIDHFKKLNDTYGHPAGDEVLRTVVRAIRSSIEPGGVVARWGGDEFVVLLPRTQAETERFAENLRTAVGRQLAHFATEENVTISIGVSRGASERKLAEALKDADEALYNSKRLGRDRVSLAGQGVRAA